MVNKRGTFLLPIVVVVLLLICIANVSAQNVAYIYIKDFRIDRNIVALMNSSGLKVDLIKEKDVPSTNFNKYDIIFVGDENFRQPNKIPVNDK
ncbi:MAG: hypothetical protein AABY10_01130, partial [Nanoarchaeota archaeon]